MQSTSKARLDQLVRSMSEEEAAIALAGLQVGMAEKVLAVRKIQDLRYGENPHQEAALYASTWPPCGLAGARQLQGPTMSFTNWLDADAGLGLVGDFEQPAAAIIKPTNPCGFAVADSIVDAYDLALECDPRAAYGGVVALNRPLDGQLAGRLAELFFNVLVTPPVAEAPLTTLRESLRVLVIEHAPPTATMDVRSIDGGLLVQTKDLPASRPSGLRVMTRLSPAEEQLPQLLNAWKLSRHVKSNAVVIVRDGMAVGIGAGQMSRIEAAELAIARAGTRAHGAMVASDGLIPFPDVIEALAAAGVQAVIQPGGSTGDAEVVAAADDLGLAMVSTTHRHFRH